MMTTMMDFLTTVRDGGGLLCSAIRAVDLGGSVRR